MSCAGSYFHTLSPQTSASLLMKIFLRNIYLGNSSTMHIKSGSNIKSGHCWNLGLMRFYHQMLLNMSYNFTCKH